VLVVIGAGATTAGLTSVSIVPGVPLVALGLLVTVWSFAALTPPGTLRIAQGLPAAVMLRGVLTFAFFAADAYVPLALQDWRGTTAAASGVALTAATLAWSAGAWIQARGIARHGARGFIRLGFATVLLGILGFAAVLSPAVPVALGVVTWAVAGLGMGFAYSALSLITLAAAAPGEEGAASSALQLSDVLGTALGTGVGGALVAAGLALGVDIWWGLAAAFVSGAAAGGVGATLSGRLPDRTTDAPAGQPTPDATSRHA
jgi:MFS family permease